MEKAIKNLMRVYVIIMLCIYPLFITPSGYDSIDVVKYRFFFYTSVGMIVIIGLMGAYGLGRRILGGRVGGSSDGGSSGAGLCAAGRRRLYATDICAAAYIVVCVISYFISPYRSEALWGFGGWWMGLAAQIILVLIYVCVSRGAQIDRRMLLWPMGVACVVYAIGVIQRFGFDPFVWYATLTSEQISEFVTTLGQITWYSSYAMLILPMGIYVYITARDRRERVPGCVYLCMHAAMLCTTYCDSAYLAAAVIMIVMGIYASRDAGRVRRFLEAVLMFIVVFGVTGILRTVCADRVVPGLHGADELCNRLMDLRIVVPALVIVGAMYVWVRRRTETFCDDTAETSDGGVERPSDDRIGDASLGRYVRVVMWVVLGVFAIGAVVVAAGAYVSQTAAGSGLLNFDDNWGNNRGFIWRIACETYERLPLQHKLIGTGPDTFSYMIYGYYGDEVRHLVGDHVVVNAHNEWLNMLINEGVIGLAAYAGIFISAIVAGVRQEMHRRTEASESMSGTVTETGNHADGNHTIVWIAAICAYFLHNFFCYQQCICTPIIFIMIGFVAASQPS